MAEQRQMMRRRRPVRDERAGERDQGQACERNGRFGAVPILAQKRYEAPSVFEAKNLLREARRQKRLPARPVPAICALDPDGDLVDYLLATGQAERDDAWACYHTTLYCSTDGGLPFGIIGRVVGAPFAVLVAEELFASGCELLISVTSAGQITPLAQPPYTVLIERALRDEGTSYHYLPPAPYSYLRPGLCALLTASSQSANRSGLSLPTAAPEGSAPFHYIGASWTTDAPFRETEAMIASCRAEGVLAVEMEAAALYALAEARRFNIVCYAHVTNQMGQDEGDFEKGEDAGSATTLRLIEWTARRWQDMRAHTT